MKTFAIFVLAGGSAVFAGSALVNEFTVAAHGLPNEPDCAIRCLSSPIVDSKCGWNDVSCQCKPDTQEKLYKSAGECLVKSCDADELFQVQRASDETCSPYRPGIQKRAKVKCSQRSSSNSSSSGGDDGDSGKKNSAPHVGVANWALAVAVIATFLL